MLTATAALLCAVGWRLYYATCQGAAMKWPVLTQKLKDHSIKAVRKAGVL